MDSDELANFKKQWEEKWCATLTVEKIEEITENLPYEVEGLTEANQTVYQNNQ